jgi:hypothetical protein
MRKTLSAIVIGIMLALSVATPSFASDRGDWWRAKAEIALTEFLDIDSGNQDIFAYGSATSASANLYGWQDSRTTSLLAKMLSKKKPDGGYGLDIPYDGFGDGTINPATTSYTVSMAGHAGPALLEGYKAGVIPKSELQGIVTKLVAAPRVAVSRGECVAYSYNPNDIGHCVHNVNAGVGWFLMEAGALGVSAVGLQKMIANITVQEVWAYKETSFWWPYKDNDTALQDADHESYTAEGMYHLAYWVGREAAYRQMINVYTDTPQAPVGHIRLIGLPGGVSSGIKTNPDTTLWCQMGDKWKTEAETYLNAQTEPGRLAQFSYYASRNSFCGDS